jgi:hypothetical protein
MRSVWSKFRVPRGPKGEKRPADVIGNAVRAMRIATGEIGESTPPRKTQQRSRLGARAVSRAQLDDGQAAQGDRQKGGG